MNILNFITLGSKDADNLINIKRAQKTTAYIFVTLLAMLTVAIVNIYTKNYRFVKILVIHSLLLMLNLSFFIKFKNLRSYPIIFSVTFLYMLLSAVLIGGLRGFGPYLIEVYILLVFSLLNRGVGTILISILLLTNLFAYNMGDKINFIYNYKESISFDVFIKFYVIHFGVAVLGYINNLNQEKMFVAIEDEKDKNKQLFLNLVHDLKTPLTILENKVDLTINKNAENKDLLSLKKTVFDMSHNIVTIIDLEKNNNLITNEISINSINITDLTYEVIESYKSFIESNDLTLKYKIEENLFVNCTNLEYRKILNNLVDNAIKYNSSNGVIYIYVYRVGREVVLSVRDQGIGISKKDFKNIFQPYTQLQRGVKSKYGLGLGLSIVKSICDKIEAKIEVDSKENYGTSFTVSFYSAKEVSSKSENLRGEVVPNLDYKELSLNKYKKTLLIVDDHYEIRTLLYEAFITEYNVILAKNGEEALLKLNKKIDLIITDLMMPKLDGIGLLKRLKESTIPIIFISAKAVSEDIINSLSLGAVDYITKPFSINQLKLKINSLLRAKDIDRKKILDHISKNLTDYVNSMNNKRVNESEKNLDRLTSKEKLIVEYLTAGVSQKNIAIELGLSINTVKSHLQRIYKKYDVHNVTGLLSKI